MKVDDSRMNNRKILRLTSESGDDYSFRIKIDTTDDELEKLLRQELPDEWVKNEDGEYDGPGFRGSYLYILEEDKPANLN